jgi:hypothetical protein
MTVQEMRFKITLLGRDIRNNTLPKEIKEKMSAEIKTLRDKMPCK